MRAATPALCTALVCAALPLCALAQPMQHGLPRLSREGWGFSCQQTKVQLEWNEKNDIGPDAACGQIGPLRLGMSRADAEKILGEPAAVKDYTGKIFYVYSLQMDEAKHMVTYAVIGYDGTLRADNIQIAGVPWDGAWTFADIKLGDPGKAVIARLGEPHGISPGSENGTLLWDYLPWSFSFEVKGPVVSSIRVSE